jgi:SNF2 family DNA or RNA helicase
MPCSGSAELIRLNDARAIHSRSPPQAGNFVEVRGRRWLVEEVEAGQPSTASLSCIDDDAQGDELRVIWDVELDARLLDDDPWSYLARAEAQDEADEEAAAEQASLLGARGGEAADLRAELAAVNEMLAIAENAKTRADARSRWLKSWIIENLLDRSDWNDRRLIVFTEYEDTRRWLERRLKEAIADTDRADERIAVFSGITGADRREAIKQAFNADPANEPLRILICTDAAREGINLQTRCFDLVHFDLPWNP